MKFFSLFYMKIWTNIYLHTHSSINLKREDFLFNFLLAPFKNIKQDFLRTNKNQDVWEKIPILA